MNLPRGGPGTEGVDGALRDATAGALGRWREQLGAHGRSAPVLALIEREADQLRAMALQHHAATLADRLYTVARLATAAPAAIGSALERVAELLEPTAAAGTPAGSEILNDTVVMQSPPGPPGPPSMLQPPSLLGASLVSNSGVPSLAPPSLLVPSGQSAAAPPASPVTASTMVSAGVSSRDAVQPAAPRPAAGTSRAHSPGPAPAPAPAASHPPSVVLPDSVVPPVARPMLLSVPFFGYRAFGKARREATPAASGAAAPAGGLLGLRRPAPLPASPPALPRLPTGASPSAAAHTARPRQENGQRAPTGRTPAQRPPRAVPAWFVLVGAVIVLLAVATAIVIAMSARTDSAKASRPAPTEPIASKSASGAPAAWSPTAAAGSTEPPAAAPTSAVHAHGAETPQLRALLDMQGQLALQCRNDPSACRGGWTPLARDALLPVDKSSLVLTPPPDAPLPAWLHSLKLPNDLPVRDEPALRNLFDYDTKNIAGRQAFQAKVFQCSAYSDIFESTLTKYGAPHWLTAVVYQESSCNPLATSPVGARGLWQFMPESARAYGLRVEEGEIDERLNPVKATDAALHFLTDLQRKLGSWELVLAAYNMGPFAVLMRVSQLGDNVGFWELKHAGVLPDETAGYVPSIEAQAIILQNLARLQFNPYGKRLESTAEVMLKPGTRLSLLARAASTTTAHIRDLNPEFLRDVVPDGSTTARVPDSEVHRAQAFLDSWSPSDNRDTCVPPDFDWGAQQFETSRYAKSCQPNAAP